MQLCDEKTVLWRPVKDEILNSRRIVEQTGVHPTNMALARAVIGDASTIFQVSRVLASRRLLSESDFCLRKQLIQLTM